MLCQTKLVCTVCSWITAVNGHLPCNRTYMKTSQLRPKPMKHSIKVACWNIRTMLDNANSSHPERRTAFIAHELSRLDIDVTSLNEGPHADEVSLQEPGANCSLRWFGKPSSDIRLSGAGTMMINFIASSRKHHPRTIPSALYQFDNHWLKKGICTHMKIYVVDQHLTLFCVYAPTITIDAAVKHSFS